MASALTSAKLSSELKIGIWDHDPGTASAIVATSDGSTKLYLDGSLYTDFEFLVNTSVLSGTGVTLVELVAADDTAMSTNLTVIVSSGAVAADAIADYVVVECTADQIAQLSAASGYSLRYVSVRVTCQGAGDEAKIVYVARPIVATSGLTATYIS